MISSNLILALALVGHHPSDLDRSPNVNIGVGVNSHGRVGVGVGIGFDFGDHYMHRHCRGYEPRYVYVDRPVYVDQPVYVERPVVVSPPPVVVEKQVFVDRPVEKTVYVDKPVEHTVYIDRTVFVDGGKTTIVEKVDGKVKSITHAPSEPKKLDENAEMAVLFNIRDEINRKLPMEVATIVGSGSNKTVEVVLRATKFAPYDRVTRRYVVSAGTLTAVGSDLTIHFNADQEGVSDLASDFQDLLLKMGNECLAQGGDWYLDNKFQAEPKKENAKPLKDVLADLDAAMKK